MPREMHSIWWDDNLGPLIGRSWPEGASITSEEALRIFMGHGIHQESRIGYTNLCRGLVVSVLIKPNCLAVLLDDNDDPARVERNLLRLVHEMDLESTQWDTEIARAFERLQELMRQTDRAELLARKGVRRLIEAMEDGLVPLLSPNHVFKGVDKYPDAAGYLPGDDEEVNRTLQDLVAAGILVARSRGRRFVCTRCSSTEMILDLRCPSCGSFNLYVVYGVHCPHCGKTFKSVIVDETEEISCPGCRRPIPVDSIRVLDIEVLCNDCSTATPEPRVTLRCASCARELSALDLLSGTGLAYHLNPSWRKPEKTQ